MGKKNNKTCIICRHGYRYCNTCGEDAGKPSWYSIFDGKNCHDIYEVCVGYRDKILNAKDAYNRISKLDISGLEDFNETTKNQIKEIISLNEKDTKKPVNEDCKVEVTEASNKTVYQKNNKKINASDFK